MSRYVRGVMKDVHAEPGTILGPNGLGELLVVVEDRPEGVALGFATAPEVAAALVAPEPRSVAEVRLRQQVARAGGLRASAPQALAVSASERDGRARAGRTRRERRVWRQRA